MTPPEPAVLKALERMVPRISACKTHDANHLRPVREG